MCARICRRLRAVFTMDRASQFNISLLITLVFMVAYNFLNGISSGSQKRFEDLINNIDLGKNGTKYILSYNIIEPRNGTMYFDGKSFVDF